MNVQHSPRLPELLDGFCGDLIPDIEIQDITLDSRKVAPGSLFFAVQGIENHGLDFAQAAIDNGAVAIAWETADSQPNSFSVPLLEIESLGKNVGLIANRFFKMPSDVLKVVGVTGTNGKTSVAHFIAQVLDKLSARCGVIGTLGAGFPNEITANGYTTPDAVEVHRQLAFFVKHHAKYSVMEVSSHALDQGRVTAVSFDTAVFTNLTQDHLDYHGDMKTYADAKRRLFHWPGLQHAVINADDSLGLELLEEIAAQVDTLAYSVNGPIPGVRNLLASNFVASIEGLSFDVTYSDECVALTSRLIGMFNVQNLLAAIGVLLVNDFTLEDAVRSVQKLEPVSGRMQRIAVAKNEPLIVIDYAHTPDALDKALSSLRGHTEGKLICIFGCGGDRDWKKRPFMGEIAERLSDMYIITNDNPRSEDPEEIIRQIRAGLKNPRRVLVIQDREEAIRAALDVARKGDCVLVTGKGHENYQIIGHEKITFSDQEVVERLLKERRGVT